MAGAKSSKTAKASVRAGSTGKSGGFERAAETPRFIPCGQGYAYVCTPDGKSLHTKVGSPKFAEAVVELVAKERPRVERDIAALEAKYPTTGWAAAFEAATKASGETVAA